MDTYEEASHARNLLWTYKQEHRFGTRRWNSMRIEEFEGTYHVLARLEPSHKFDDNIARLQRIAEELGVLELVSEVRVIPEITADPFGRFLVARFLQ